VPATSFAKLTPPKLSNVHPHERLFAKLDELRRSPAVWIENWPWPLKMMTLGGFAVLKDDVAITFLRKAPKKVLSLLKAIVAFGRTAVPERSSSTRSSLTKEEMLRAKH